MKSLCDDHPTGTWGVLLKETLDRYRWAWSHLRNIAKPAIAFEFWFTLLYVIVLTPMSAWLLNRLVASSGQLAVTNQDLTAFFLSARGMAFLLLNVAFVLVLGFAEQVGLLIIAIATCFGRKVSVSSALREQIIRMPALIRLGILQAACYVAVCIPFAAAIALTYWVFLGKRDISYYLAAQPWEWWAALAIAAVWGAACLLLGAWLFVRWLFAIPALVFEKASPMGALKKSWQCTRSRFWSLAVSLALWWLGVLIASLAITWLIKSAAAQVLINADLELTVVLPTVVGALAVTTIADLGWIIIGKTVHTMLIVGVYLETAQAVEKDTAAAWAQPRISPAGLRALGWAGAGVALLAAIAAGVVYLERLDLTRRVAVTAHRGSSLKAPENTLSALRRAVADDADYAEIDVQTTADGVVVLMHDADLMRIASVNRKIEEIGYDELKTVDIGSWFAPTFSSERIATLAEAIDFAQGRIKLNIELKFNRPDPELANKVGDIVRKKEFATECVISSLDYRALTKVKGRFPELKTGLIVFEAVGNPSKTEMDFLSVNARRATSRLVKQAHRSGKEVHVWTVNDPHNALSMIELGVDNIITDNPEGLQSLLRAWNNLSDSEKIALMVRNLILGDNYPLPSDL